MDAGADPYDLQKTALEAMPDDTKVYNKVVANAKFKGRGWDRNAKCVALPPPLRPSLRPPQPLAAAHRVVHSG